MVNTPINLIISLNWSYRGDCEDASYRCSWGKFCLRKIVCKYCMGSACNMHVNKVKIKLTWMLFEDILTSAFEGRFSEVESLTEQQTESLFRIKSYPACVFAVYPRWKKVAADRHVLKLPFTLTRLTAVIFTEIEGQVHSLRNKCFRASSLRKLRREQKKGGERRKRLPANSTILENCVRPRTQLLIGAVIVVLIT